MHACLPPPVIQVSELLAQGAMQCQALHLDAFVGGCSLLLAQ